MYNFEYHRPASLEEASKAITSGEDVKIVAGGMTLVPTLKQRLAMPSDLIDLGGIAEIKGICEEDGSVVIGAMTTHADDFFTGMFETALEEDEIIVSVAFPVPSKAAYAKFDNPASRYAIVGVFVAQTSDGVRVAVTGAGPCVFRAAEMEQALSGNFSADAISSLSVSADGLNSDIHASADYRAHLVGVMAKRAVAAA